MNDIDEQIRKALNEEDRAAIAQIGDQAGLFEMIGMSLRGRQAWLTYYMWVLGLATFVFGLYAVNEFFSSDEIASQLAWMLAINTCLAVFIVIKVIGWMQMNKLETMREIKRLELRLLTQKDQA